MPRGSSLSGRAAMAHLRPGNFSWAEPYLESPWVKVMAALAPQFPSPDDSESSEVWRHFALACAGGAAVLAGLGVVATLAVLLRSCCCYSRMPQARPSSKPMLCGGVLTFILAVAGICAYLLVGRKGVTTATDEISKAIGDITSARDQGLVLAALGAQLSGNLSLAAPLCQQAPGVQAALAAVQAQIDGYRSTVDEYNTDMQDIPGKLSDVKSALHTVSDLTLYGLGIPLALVLLCCTAIVVVGCATRCRAEGSGRCSNCCIKSLGLLLFAPAILVVAAVSAGEFGAGLALGSFCKDVDTNTLTYVHKFATGGIAYNATRFYINGTGSNPLLDQLEDANQTLNNLKTTLAQDGPTIAAACTPQLVSNISATLAETQEPLNTWGRLLSPEHIYPYYKTSVREDACKTLLSGLGWLVVFQYIVGLVCLPALVCSADKFLDRWVRWNAQPATRVLMIATEMSV